MAERKLHILLDNGHGADTSGKRSPIWEDGTQLHEWAFNRSIVKKLAEMLTDAGIAYDIIVPEDKDVSLSERVKRINNLCNKYGAANCLMISVHANAGGGTGWEVYTTKGQNRSDSYAEIFADEAEWTWTARPVTQAFKMRFDISDGDKDKEAQFTVIYGANCPAILTENFFMDTYFPDCKYIMSTIGQNEVAEMHFRAIEKSIKWWEENILKA